MRIWSVLLLFFTIGVSAIIVVVNSGFFDDINEVMTQQLYSFEWRLNLDLAFLALLQDIAFRNNDMSDEFINQFSLLDPPELLRAFDFSPGLLRGQAVEFLSKSEKAFETFIHRLTLDAARGVNIHETATSYLLASMQMPICEFDGSVVRKTNFKLPISLNAIASFLNNFVVVLFSLNDNRINTTEMCVLVHSIPVLSKAQDEYTKKIRQYQYDWSKSKKIVALVQLLTIPLAVFIIGFIPYLIFYRLFIKDLQTAIDLSVKIDEKIRASTTNPISLLSNESLESATEIVASHKKRFILVVIMMAISTFISPLFLIISLYKAMTLSVVFGSLSGWILYGGATDSYLVESLLHIFIGLCLRDEKYTTLDEQFENAQISAENIHRLLFSLMRGTDTMDPVTGFSKEYDRLSSANRCTMQRTNDPHMEYACLGLDQTYEYAIGYVDKLYKTKGVYNKSAPYPPNMNNPAIGHLLHIFNAHIYYDSVKQANLLNGLGESQSIAFQNFLNICIIVNVLASILAFILMTSVPSMYDNAYKTALLVFRRLPPSYILLDQNLQYFLLNSGRQSNDGGMSLHQKCVHNANNLILILNKNQIIETTNRQITDILNYNPEQLLGQNVVSIFTEDCKEKIQENLSFIHLNQIDQFEDNVTCLTSSNQSVHCYLTIIGIKKKDELTNYILALNDMTDFNQKKQLVEITKTKAESLFYEMLPREIVPKIQNREKNISFSAEQVSVMVIDIENFSEYSASSTPAETFISLSKVYCKCESILKNHPVLIKLKLVGDTFIVTAGLFDGNSVDPKIYTEEMINFGLECIKAIEELNIIRSTNFSIRIGMDIGGPVICGLVGEERMSFDVFGEPLQNAFNFQSTGISGKIRISQNVFDLVKDLSFVIEKCDDLILKRKKRIQTYLIVGRKEGEVGRLRSGHSSSKSIPFVQAFQIDKTPK